MDKMSMWSVLFVSFPEEILFVIITLSAIGYKEVLNFKKAQNVMKLLLASSIMVLSVVITHSFVDLITFNGFIQILMFYLAIISVYRYKILNTLLGHAFSYVVLIFGDVISVVISTQVLGVSLEAIYADDLTRLLVSLPTKIVQVAAILIICKLKKIDLKLFSVKFDDFMSAGMYLLIIISSALSIETAIRNSSNNISDSIRMGVYTFIIVMFSTWLIFKFSKLKKNEFMKDNMHDVELHHIKHLLEEGRTEYALELITQTLEESKKVNAAKDKEYQIN